MKWVRLLGMMLLSVGQAMFAEVRKDELFRTPELIAAKISPDGETLAYVGADQNGLPNVFVKSREHHFDASRQITFFHEPEIIQFYWSAKSDKILFLKDEKGTGQLHLHGVDIHSQKHTIYTQKIPRVNAKVVQISPRENTAIVGLNSRDPRFFDLYTLDLDTGELQLAYENHRYAKFLVSEELEIILKMRINEDGSWTAFTADDRIFLELDATEAFHTEFLSYDAKTQAIYLLDNRYSDTTQLLKKSLVKTEEKLLGHQDERDIDDVLFFDGEPKAYASYYVEKQWHILDPAMAKDFAFLEKNISRNFEVINKSSDGHTWIVWCSIPDVGSRFWIYERKTQELIPLSKTQKESRLAKMYPLVVKTRDGLTLVCYYTLPIEHDRGGVPDKPIPLIVDPHGGPFKARDKYECNPYHQWLASCGYAVLSVNFRLSSGFGKAFVNAGNGEWGGKAHLDIIDAVEACIAKNIAERSKIAIFGGSYGGYEALASLTFTPDFFRCSVAICGPSSLKTVLNHVPPFWEFTVRPLSDKTAFFTKKAFITSMGGDPDEAKGIAYLEKCSPLNYLEAIQSPLLLVHGQNDHVVVEKESRQIFDSMKARGQKVTYILFPDEGHRMARFPNKMFYMQKVEQFLADHLGGRCHSLDPALTEDSSAIIYN